MAEKKNARVRKHVSIAERLQDRLLAEYERLLNAGEMTAGDRKNLQDLLLKMGWNFDPSTLPEDLRHKLTERIDPSELPDPAEFGNMPAEA